MQRSEKAIQLLNILELAEITLTLNLRGSNPQKFPVRKVAITEIDTCYLIFLWQALMIKPMRISTKLTNKVCTLRLPRYVMISFMQDPTFKFALGPILNSLGGPGCGCAAIKK